MAHDEYWVAITYDGALRGGGFLLTRYFALTTTCCLPGAVVGDSVELRTADGRPVEGAILDMAEDLGLALLSVRPREDDDYATPLADHASKGDVWHAPYRPGPANALLGGTVGDVSADRRIGDGRAVSVLELASEQEPCAYDTYAGGPVERSGEGADSKLVGILLEPETAGRLGSGGDNPLSAAAIHSVVRVFEDLSALALLNLLGTTAPNRPKRPVVAQVDEEFDRSEQKLRRLRKLETEGLVDPHILRPYQVRVLDDLFDTLREEGEW